jgi:hypothetical protein
MNVLGYSGDHHSDREENDGSGQGGRTAEQVGDLIKVEQVEVIDRFGSETMLRMKNDGESGRKN